MAITVSNIFIGGVKIVSASFSVPTQTVLQGDFIEFAFNIQNTGSFTTNVSTGVDVYNSSNVIVATINSTNVTLSPTQAKTIVTFDNSLNLAAGSYTAHGLVFFDNRTTVNMSSSFNITSSTNVVVGNYTNTSLSFTANTPITIYTNTSSATTSNISIVLNSSQDGAIAVSEYSSLQNQTNTGQTALGKFVSLTPSTNITNNIGWYWLNISYTSAEIASAGLTESGMRIWFYNTSTASWQQESNSGVDTNNKYVWANITHFSLFGIYGPAVTTSSATTTTNTGGGGLGGSYAAPLPTSQIKFTDYSILQEIPVGQSAVESITVTNTGTIGLSNLNIQVSGIPADWVNVVPQTISLNPQESKTFNLVVSVPDGVDAGDYKMLITLTGGGVQGSVFMIIRVKSLPANDNPIVTRNVQLDYADNKTKIILEVDNGVKSFPLVQVQEEIPKTLASSAQQVEFNPYPDEILQNDPVVQWNIKDLAANQMKDLSYLTNGILYNFATYIYMPLKQLTIVETKLPSGLDIVDLSISQLLSGQSSTGKLIIENIGNVPKNLDFSMQLPAGWKMEPQDINATIAAGETKELDFSIIVPNDAVQGDHIGTAIIVWGGDTYIRELVMHVGPIYTMWIYAGVIFAIAALAFLFFRSRAIGPPVYESPLTYKLRQIQTSIQAMPMERELTDVAKLRTELAQDVKEKLKREVIKELVKRASERVG